MINYYQFSIIEKTNNFHEELSMKLLRSKFTEEAFPLVDEIVNLLEASLVIQAG